MEYTLFSVMLCHAWSFSVMDGVGHWGCNSPGDCKFIVLHFYIFPGVLPCVAKKQCSHHIPKITTVDIQPDGKYNFRKDSAVDKRQKSLRLILLNKKRVIFSLADQAMRTNGRDAKKSTINRTVRQLISERKQSVLFTTYMKSAELNAADRLHVGG